MKERLCAFRQAIEVEARLDSLSRTGPMHEEPKRPSAQEVIWLERSPTCRVSGVLVFVPDGISGGRERETVGAELKL